MSDGAPPVQGPSPANLPEVPASDTLPAPRDRQAWDRWLNGLLRRDAVALSRQLDRVRRATPAQWQPNDADEFRAKLNAARAAYAQRLAQVPKPRFTADLPVLARRAEIASLIAEHQVVVMCGETGSGKSTQLPQICLDLGRGVHGLIGHTQPRRIAARSVATRVAEELSVTTGAQVGFKVRFQDATGPNTYIKLMTDGILLAETQHDRLLWKYDTLIIDEAHERSLNIDFLLGYLRQILPKRPDLRLIITSATIDVERFSEHFSTGGKPVPIIEVQGRTYPVDVRYLPIADDAADDPQGQSMAIANTLDQLMREGSGDALVFLATERDIHETAKYLRGRSLGAEILPLYARLSVAEQQRIMRPGSARRIVLSTNVAESSLTVPGITYVIDTGLARVSRYSPRTKLQRLPIEPISQASANQRAGRCGRVGPGVCVRLYSSDDFLKRERFTCPELQRTSLAAVILQCESLQLGHVADFPFIDPPKLDAIRDGYRTLFELSAVDSQNQLTPLGRRLAQFPVDPRIGRLLLAAIDEHCLAEVLIIASVLEAQDPRERPIEKQQAADEAHAQFKEPRSDFLSYLKLWDFYHDLKDKLSRGQLEKACRQNFLSPLRMREWVEVHRELADLVPKAEQSRRKASPDFDAIHRALLTGFLSNVAQRTETGEYLVAGGQKAHLWPGSAIVTEKPKWILAGEQVETSRRFLRTAAVIDPAWVERLAAHLVNRTYSEPHWLAERLAAHAFERVLLFGLPIIPRRRVVYTKVDPQESRRLLIEQGLVAGEFPSPPPFVVANRELYADLEKLEARLRRPILIADIAALCEFYNQRLPHDVCDGTTLKRWYQQADAKSKQALLMQRHDLLLSDEADELSGRFPAEIDLGAFKAPLEYQFAPGTSSDGLTVTVTQQQLAELETWRLDWLVPGLINEKLESLIRSLPKDDRRTLVPIPDTARDVANALLPGRGPLAVVLANHLNEKYRTRVLPQMFDVNKLPTYLTLNLKVIGESGDVLAEGRDLSSLRSQLGVAAKERFATVNAKQWTRSGLKTWDFGGLPAVVELERDGMRFQGYPSLCDEGTAAGLRLFEQPHRAAKETALGVRRLCLLEAVAPLQTAIRKIPQWSAWRAQATIFPPPIDLLEDVTVLVAQRAFIEGQPLPRSPEQFRAILIRGREELPVAVSQVTKLLAQLFPLAVELRKSIEGMSAATHQIARLDIQKQAGRLLAPGFLRNTPWGAIVHFPRYLTGVLTRISKLNQQLAKDQAHAAELARLSNRCWDKLKQAEEWGTVSPELEAYRWQLEELRVSLFAQELGTQGSVSIQRLDRLWETIAKS